MTNEEAITYWEQLKKTFSESRDHTTNELAKEHLQTSIDAIDVALNAIRGHGSEPLTLEQLREMVNKPYWHVSLRKDGGAPHWSILDPLLAYHPEDYDYGETWLAYSYPPANIDREAWISDWRELHGDKIVGLDDFGEYVYRHYHYSVCKSCRKGSAVKSNFCPSCGRAMTPEAWAELEKRLRG